MNNKAPEYQTVREPKSGDSERTIERIDPAVRAGDYSDIKPGASIQVDGRPFKIIQAYFLTTAIPTVVVKGQFKDPNPNDQNK